MQLAVSIAIEIMLGLLALAVLYLFVLTAAGLLGARNCAQRRLPQTRFAVLIPAHDEESVIAEALASFQRVRYPSEQFDVHVVADNCQDHTADVARGFENALHLTVHERHDPTKHGKGYAVEWLLGRLGPEARYDAYVMLDADWTVAPNFLDVMNSRLQAGAEMVQAWCRVAQPDVSWVAGLRCVAFALVNYVRPLGLDTLGLSCGLKGTGMGFAGSMLRQYAWTSHSLIEDSEQHAKLLLAGRRVEFAPETFIESRMPATLSAAYSQNLRWESGKIALLRDYAPPLLRMAARTGDLSALHEVVALLVPPLSILGVLCVGLLGATFAVGSGTLQFLALMLVCGFALHVGVGLAMVRPPAAVYRSLLLAPVFILWKLGVYARALSRRGRGPWMRTQRPGEVFE